MNAAKARKQLVLEAPKTEEAQARRRYRQRISRDQEAFHELVEEASRLMDRCRISHHVRQVPDWMMPLAAWSLKRSLRLLNYPVGYHDDLYETVQAGFQGDLTTVEMWILAHEYDD